jgi:hypothetical protein
LTAAFCFAGVLLFVGVFVCAALAAAFCLADALLFAGVFISAAFAGFFVVFVIVITLHFHNSKVTVRIDVNYN